MRKSIEQFKSSLATGGLRPTMYEVDLTIPSYINDYLRKGQSSRSFYEGNSGFSNQFMMLCKATSIPASTTTTVSVGLPAGESLKLPGSRIFEPWNTSVISDGQMRLRNVLEAWSEIIIGHPSAVGAPNLSDFMGSAQVKQLNRRGEPVRSYNLEYLYPQSIEAQDLAFDAFDTIAEFNVVWNYHYFHVSRPSPLEAMIEEGIRDLFERITS